MNRALSRWLTAGVTLGLLFCAGMAQATTYTVINSLASGPGSLRQAILDANANAGADTINFNVTGLADFVNGGRDGYTISRLPPPSPAGVFLYGLQDSPHILYKMDLNGNVISSVLLSGCTSGFTYGLAANPVDGKLYCISDCGGGGRHLVRIDDPELGTVVDLGVLTHNLSDIAFGPDGTLYGVAGNNQGLGSNLYRITYSGSLVMTLMSDLPGGGGGQTIMWNYSANKLYHITSSRMQYINNVNDCAPGSCPTTLIRASGLGEHQAATGIGNGGFIAARACTNLNNIALDGTVSRIAAAPACNTMGLATLPVFTGDFYLSLPLPAITDVVTIDGTTQPGASVFNHLIEIEGFSIGLTGPASSGSVIRGLVINRSPSDGIRASQNSINHLIENNFIGTDPTGTQAKANLGSGAVNLDSGYGHIVRSNLVSGNDGNGILLNEHVTPNGGNSVLDNKIGTDITGTLPIPNALAGIVGWCSNNLFEGNSITFNAGDGIILLGSGANSVRKNVVFNNGGRGILLGSGGNLVGGLAPGEGNIIAFNSLVGVSVQSLGVNNAILGNSIYSNGLLGIDLGLDGVTLNDLLDADAGPNQRQNFPALDAIQSIINPGFAIAAGSLSSEPNTDYLVQVFGDDAGSAVCFPVPGYTSASCGVDQFLGAEGRHFLGSFSVHTDANGYVAFGQTLVNAVPAPGRFMTATATKVLGGVPVETSEFSEAIEVGAADLINALITKVKGLPGVKSSIKNALVVKLNAAQKALSINDKPTACVALKDFIDLCVSQKNKKLIPANSADELIADAMHIRTVIGCSP